MICGCILRDDVVRYPVRFWQFRMVSKPLTTKELIAELQKWPEDAFVWTEGCDCYGEAGGVEYHKEDNTVLITRPDD